MEINLERLRQRQSSASTITPSSFDYRGGPPGSDANSSSASSSPESATQTAVDAALRPFTRHRPRSLSGIAFRAFCLGLALSTSLILTLGLFVLVDSPLWRLPLFLAFLSTFHFLEFWTTAAYNTRAADVSSFLLTANWPGYALAHLAACLEFILRLLYTTYRSPSAITPNLTSFAGAYQRQTTSTWTSTALALFRALDSLSPLLLPLGLLLVILGQTVRTAAMAQAGPSFHHRVQSRRAPHHVLVTSGIYAHLRHPSYFGFFWWALGTQLALGNFFCVLLFGVFLWRFFRERIRAEEKHLCRFFGHEYGDYRRNTGTGLLFIR